MLSLIAIPDANNLLPLLPAQISHPVLLSGLSQASALLASNYDSLYRPAQHESLCPQEKPQGQAHLTLPLLLWQNTVDL